MIEGRSSKSHRNIGSQNRAQTATKSGHTSGPSGVSHKAPAGLQPVTSDVAASDVATRAETIAAILGRSKREWVPLRTSALRQRNGSTWEPGPLSRLVTQKDQRALDLYLLLHALASKEPFDATLPSAVWARALDFAGSPETRGTTVSRVASRLANAKLIKRDRKSRMARFTLLDESGDGSPYSHPGKSGRFLKLPYDYWRSDWDTKLELPGKFILLVALSQKNGFTLPITRAPAWYGISSDTAQRGLQELLTAGLLKCRRIRKKAPLAPEGFSYDRHFTLLPPFDKSISHKRSRHESQI